jgi:hypothetical protein
MASIAQLWFGTFMETVKTHETSTILREAAEREELKHWTEALTGIVVGTFPKMGWRGAARGRRSDLLPVSRSEYLALDVVAFEIAGDRRWRFPVGVFELENSPVDDLVAYSLWKVCACARSCGWYCATAATRAKGRSWCVTSRTRSSRRWRSQYVLVSAVKRSSSLARAAKLLLSLMDSSKTGRSTSIQRTSVGTDRRPSMALKPGTKSSLQEKISATGGRLTLPSLLFISTTFGTDGRLMTIRNRSGSLIARS